MTPYYSELYDACGSCHHSALYLAQCIHWQKLVNAGKGGHKQGFLKSLTDWVKELNFNRYFLEKARSKFKDFLTYTVEPAPRELRSIYGVSPVTRYELDIAKFKEWLKSKLPSNTLQSLLNKLGLDELTKKEDKKTTLTPEEEKAYEWGRNHKAYWSAVITSEKKLLEHFKKGKSFYEQYYRDSGKSAPSPSAPKPLTEAPQNKKPTVEPIAQWKEVLPKLKECIELLQYTMWIQPIRAVCIEGRNTLLCPNQYIVDTVKNKFLTLIRLHIEIHAVQVG